MCFPSKRTKENLTDKPQQPAQASAPPASKPASASASQPPTTSSPTVSAPNGTSSAAKDPAMSSPKVAIVIYSLYGHIAKSTSSVPLLSNAAAS